VFEKALGPDHPEVADVLDNLAEMYKAQGRTADAEPLFRAGPGCLNRFSASISGASAGIRPPRGAAEG
jgi:hypothetical protein